MAFKVGDKVHMPGVPFELEVLAVGTCTEKNCDEQTFQFKDPESGDPDWAHSSEFERL